MQCKLAFNLNDQQKGHSVKNLKLILILTTALLSVSCASKTTVIDHSHGQAATASIELPQFITAVKVNKDDVTIPFMAGYPYYLSVAEGPTTLKFIYTQNWGRNDSNLQRVKSNIMTLSFDAVAGTNYVLNYKKPPSISDVDNAGPYTDSFKAWIEAGTTQVALSNDTGKSMKGISLLAKQESSINTDRLTQLKDLWETADSEERKEFMNWVITPTE